jgi:hypothetical protein
MADHGCVWFFVHINPASGLTLDGPPRWVIVTGHREDPASAQCRWVYPDNWPLETDLDDASAVDLCLQQFILVSVRDAP